MKMSTEFLQWFEATSVYEREHEPTLCKRVSALAGHWRPTKRPGPGFPFDSSQLVVFPDGSRVEIDFPRGFAGRTAVREV